MNSRKISGTRTAESLSRIIGSIDDISSTYINGDIVQANRLATAPRLGSTKHFAGTHRARSVGQQSRGSSSRSGPSSLSKHGHVTDGAACKQRV